MPRGAQPLETLTPGRLGEIARAGTISQIYGQAQAGLTDIIREVEAIGLPQSQAEIRRLQNLQNQVDAIQNSVNNAVGRVSEPGSRAVYKQVSGSTARSVNAQLPQDAATFKATYGQADAAKVAVVAEALYRDLTGAINEARKPIDNIIRRVQLAGLTDASVTEALGVEQLAGRDVQQLAGTVANIINSEVGANGGTVKVRGSDGIVRTYTLEYYSEMVVRTRTREIATMATQQVTANAAAELKIPPLIQVTRHANESPICVDILNQAPDGIFSLDPNDPVYPDINGVGEGGPPWHPNCIHVAVPYIKVPE